MVVELSCPQIPHQICEGIGDRDDVDPWPDEHQKSIVGGVVQSFFVQPLAEERDLVSEEIMPEDVGFFLAIG